MGSIAYIYDSQSDNALISGGSWLEGLPLTNIQVADLDRIARSANTALTSTRFNILLKSPMEVASLYLGWTNLQPEAKVRVRFWPTDAFAGTPDKDTGWIDDVVADDDDPDRGPSLYLLLEPATTQFISVEIDDQSNPYGYVDIGRLITGRLYKPGLNYAFGNNGLGFGSNAIVSRTLSGGEVVRDKFEPRVFRMAFDYLDEGEVYGEMYHLLRTIKRGGEVVVIPDVAAGPLEMQRRAFLGTARGRDSLSQTSWLRGSAGLEIVEKPGLAPAALAAAFRIMLQGGAFAFSGQSMTFVSFDAGVFALTGGDVGLLVHRILPLDRGSFAMTGQGINLIAGKAEPMGEGSFVLTGNDLLFVRGFAAELDAGSFALTGQPVALTVRRLAMETGSYALLGQSIGFKRELIAVLEHGSFGLTPIDVEIASGVRVLLAEGVFVVTGRTVTLAAAKILGLNRGSFSLAGGAALLTRQSYLAMEQGAFSLTGQALTLTKQSKLAMETGSFALTGESAGLYKTTKVSLDSGTFSLTGQAADLRAYPLRVTTDGDVRVLAGDEAGNRRRTV